MSANSYPVSVTAKVLNTTEFTIRRLIKSKQLRAVRIGGQWRILAEDLESYLNAAANRPRFQSEVVGAKSVPVYA